MRLPLLRFPVLGALYLLALLGTAVAGHRFFRTQQATVIVTTTADNGPGTLRAALAAASNGDTIQFDPSLNGQTITLTSFTLLIDKSLTIVGPGADQLTVKRSTAGGTPAFPIFDITGDTVTIQGLTIRNGFNPDSGGGGILNDGATLTIANCAIIDNHAGFGGGIFNFNAQLTINNSTLSDNSADITTSGNGLGGAIYNNGGTVMLNNSMINGNRTQVCGGGIYNNGGSLIISDSTISSNSSPINGGGICGLFAGLVVTVNNSTISGNSGGGSGGGIYGGGNITNSTITGNTANQGGGVYVTSALEIGNTILNAGTNGANIVNDGGTVTSHGYNISSDNGGGFLTAPGDQINTAPMLGPLQDNGGPTFTHELLPGSPAINTGDPNFTPPPDFDQRGPGYPRVFNGRIDIGSFELQTMAPTPTPTATITPSPTPCLPVITQSSSQAITTGNSISCNNGTAHTDNSYWRAFNVGTSFGGSYIITSVSFGVESANNTQPVTVRLYRNTGGAFPGGTRTLIGTTTISVTAAQTGTVVTTPFSAALPAGISELVMELFTPDGQAAGNLFFVGSNASPESGPSYLSAAACGITTPTTTAALGVPNMHIVFNVQGYCEGTPPPPPTATATTTVTPTATATVTATATAAGTPTPSVSPTITATPTCPPVITQSTSQAITTPAPLCQNPPPMVFAYDNHYWRAFPMQSFVGGREFTVSSVSFGVFQGSATTAIIRVYANNGPAFPAGIGTLIGTTTLSVPFQTGTIVTTPLDAIVPAGTIQLVMELYVPQGVGFLLVGGNTAPETGPSYWSSIDKAQVCSSTPQVIASHLVFNVYGTCTGPPPTPTPPPPITISGTVSYCSNPNSPPVQNVTLTLTGSASATTLSDASGNYMFSVPSGGSYTVTPSKASVSPGSFPINTIDVVAVQRHFLQIGTPLSGCRLLAADVNGDTMVNTVDVTAIQRFVLALSGANANVGRYQFNPLSRTYPNINSNQTNQNYDALVFGDVTSPYIH